jgi:hypothetical protein
MAKEVKLKERVLGVESVIGSAVKAAQRHDLMPANFHGTATFSR